MKYLQHNGYGNARFIHLESWNEAVTNASDAKQEARKKFYQEQAALNTEIQPDYANTENFSEAITSDRFLYSILADNFGGRNQAFKVLSKLSAEGINVDRFNAGDEIIWNKDTQTLTVKETPIILGQLQEGALDQVPGVATDPIENRETENPRKGAQYEGLITEYLNRKFLRNTDGLPTQPQQVWETQLRPGVDGAMPERVLVTRNRLKPEALSNRITEVGTKLMAYQDISENTNIEDLVFGSARDRIISMIHANLGMERLLTQFEAHQGKFRIGQRGFWRNDYDIAVNEAILNIKPDHLEAFVIYMNDNYEVQQAAAAVEETDVVPEPETELTPLERLYQRRASINSKISGLQSDLRDARNPLKPFSRTPVSVQSDLRTQRRLLAEVQTEIEELETE